MEENTRVLLRREGNVQGGVLLIYHGIMNGAVILVTMAVTLLQMLSFLASDPSAEDLMDKLTNFPVDQVAESGNWGYLLAVAVGLVLLLLWKKPIYFRQTVFAPGKPMKAGDFASLTAVFLSAQVLYGLWYVLLENLAGLLGFSMETVLQSVSISTDSLPMFLYACLLAPVAEEILFRGLILRSLEPYGKKFSILISALLFGLFHGNILQIPFAALTGLVLGYVALEYNIIWAIVLHMMNNLLIGDVLPRLLSFLPDGLGDLIMWVFFLICALAAIIILILRWRDVRDYCTREQLEKGMAAGYFSSPCVIIFLVLSVLNMASLPLAAFLLQ